MSRLLVSDIVSYITRLALSVWPASYYHYIGSMLYSRPTVGRLAS